MFQGFSEAGVFVHSFLLPVGGGGGPAQPQTNTRVLAVTASSCPSVGGTLTSVVSTQLSSDKSGTRGPCILPVGIVGSAELVWLAPRPQRVRPRAHPSLGLESLGHRGGSQQSPHEPDHEITPRTGAGAWGLQWGQSPLWFRLGSHSHHHGLESIDGSLVHPSDPEHLRTAEQWIGRDGGVSTGPGGRGWQCQQLRKGGWPRPL